MLIVTFRLRNLSAEDYALGATLAAPGFASMPGLVAKYWLADQAAESYGAVSLWRDRAGAEAYLQSQAFRALEANPHIADIAVRHFAVLAEPTAITAGEADASRAAAQELMALGARRKAGAAR